MVEQLTKSPRSSRLLLREVGQFLQRQDGAVRVQAERAAQLIRDVLGQPAPAGGDRLHKQVSCFLVEAH